MAGTSHSQISSFECSFFLSWLSRYQTELFLFVLFVFRFVSAWKIWLIVNWLDSSNLRESIMVTNQVTRETPSIFVFICSSSYGMCFESSFWWWSFREVRVSSHFKNIPSTAFM